MLHNDVIFVIRNNIKQATEKLKILVFLLTAFAHPLLHYSFKLKDVALPRFVLLSVVGNGFSDPPSRQQDRWCRIFKVSYELIVRSILLAKQ